MAEANISITDLRARDNSTESRLPTGELAEAIELMSQAMGMLDCLELFTDPNFDLKGYRIEAVAPMMAFAAGGASKLVQQAQAFLIEANVINAEAVRHG